MTLSSLKVTLRGNKEAEAFFVARQIPVSAAALAAVEINVKGSEFL